MLKLYNTLTRKIEEFSPLSPPAVSLYTCGPTVYDYTHIGHLFKYTQDDILKRILRADGFSPKHIMNITDVGHLVSDADAGEDKLEKGAKKFGQTVWEVAKHFEEYFWKSVDAVNIERPNIVARATEHILEQIKLIQKLEQKGIAYQTGQAVYFDVSRFPDYTKLSSQKLEEKEAGAREDVRVDAQKKNPQDFALWFFTTGRFKDHAMRWPSPWGEGFPGWHIECSAMSMAYLGDSIDIHTGGIDHIPVHHTNEIAQSEAASGKQFVKYWMHYNFVRVNGEKMSKSLGNFVTIDDILNKGYDPLALRLLFLSTHYQSELNFTWESLDGVQTALNNLRDEIRAWEQAVEATDEVWQKFMEAANNNLNLPQAVALMWQMVRSDTPTSSKSRNLLEMDKILGLGLERYIATPLEIPKEVQELVAKREKVRAEKDFEKSDKLRHEIKKLGYDVLDTPTGPKVKKI